MLDDNLNIRTAWENSKIDWLPANCSVAEIRSLTAEYGLAIPEDSDGAQQVASASIPDSFWPGQSTWRLLRVAVV